MITSAIAATPEPASWWHLAPWLLVGAVAIAAGLGSRKGHQ